MNHASLCLLILAFNYAPAVQAHDHRDGHKKVMGEIHIEADSEVMGTIYLHQPVDLSISDAARINDIRRTFE